MKVADLSNETLSTRSQAEPGNAYQEALPPIFPSHKRGRASRHGFPGSAWERVNLLGN